MAHLRNHMLLLWMMLDLSSAISSVEMEALKNISSALGATYWDLTSDPCIGRWRGINCCNTNELNTPCCTSIFTDPTNSDVSPVCNTSPENSTIIAINLDSNYLDRTLTGTISESVCELQSLVTLDLNNNFLTGAIPSCIGNKLLRLKYLGLAGGNLSRGIPEELGNLSRLEQLYLDNNHLTGSIPSTIGGMESLKQLYMRNNQLSGEIPTKITNLKNLTDLNLQNNRLNGSISPLTGLTSLSKMNLFGNELSGTVNVSVFSEGLTAINLRHNRFSGSLPAIDNRFQKLTDVDLSFNSFTGSVPDILVRLPSIKTLFLGHNNLSGGLPQITSSSVLSVLDVSHNMLTGTLPSRLPPQADYSFNSLQVPVQQGKTYFSCISNKSTPCSRTNPGEVYTFTVHAGGTTDFKNRDETVFYSDVVTNDTGLRYFPRGDWALEISGAQNGILTTSPTTTIASVPSEDDQSLYQSIRWSSSYLAYHGTNVANGTYEVTLYFCEIVFRNTSYRAFDVRINNKLVVEKLDVAKFGIRTAHRLQENVTVVDGGLSIELIYTGPDLYIDPNKYPVQSSGAMISAIKVRSWDPPLTSSSAWKIKVGVSIGTVLLVFMLVLMVFYYRKAHKRSQQRRSMQTWSSLGIRKFTYKELYVATDGFNPKLKLGQGGFGSVYMGYVDGDKLVAIKQLLHQTQQGRDSFKKEIQILSSVQHRNLVAVRGYCIDSENPMLVCDYMKNGSLDMFLHGNKGFLSWEQRRRIAVETAFGLAYLHDESKHRIIHCDLKPPNILLDDNMNPRIADFGMARLYEEGRSHVTATRMGGTIGYLAPEYAMHYQLSDKADVYSFGMVLLEMLSGRRAVESGLPLEKAVLVDYAHSLATVSTLELIKLIDDKLIEQCDVKEAVDMARIAVLCTMESPSLRPKIRSVWLMLKGTMQIPDIPLTADTRLSTVKALMSAYEQHSSLVFNSQKKLITISPR